MNTKNQFYPVDGIMFYQPQYSTFNQFVSIVTTNELYHKIDVCQHIIMKLSKWEEGGGDSNVVWPNSIYLCILPQTNENVNIKSKPVSHYIEHKNYNIIQNVSSLFLERRLHLNNKN